MTRAEMTSDLAWRESEARLGVFASLAHLYAPVDPSISTAIAEAGEAWALSAETIDADSAIWGNAPRDAGSAGRMARWASRRELAVLRFRLRRRWSSRVRAIHRLRPPRRVGAARNTLRAALLAGLVVKLGRGAGPRVIDAVMDAAGGTADVARLRPSRDGSALLRLDARDGSPVELRVATEGGRKDPARNADALAALERSGVPLVPRLVGKGVTAGAAWTTESVLPGVMPSRLAPSLRYDVADFCALLPRSQTPTSIRERMARLAERYPRWAGVARRLASAAPAGVPGIVQHGDLWAGNLLAEHGRLEAVVDWDTWHPAGLPGVDLVQLVAMERRSRTGEDIGDLWRARIWTSEEYSALAEPYWERLGVEPSDALLDAVGLDWWSGQLFKRQSFASRAEWRERNVDAVLAALDDPAAQPSPPEPQAR